MQIRLLQTDDSVSELTRLLHRAYRRLAEMGLHYVATHQSEDITRRRLAGGECYVALDDRNAIVGTILFKDASATRGCPYYERPGVASFHQFAVDPQRQGEGIGDALLKRVESRARETKAAEITLDTADSAHQLIAFYEKRGYRVVARADWEETNYQSVVMAKRIKADQSDNFEASTDPHSQKVES